MKIHGGNLYSTIIALIIVIHILFNYEDIRIEWLIIFLTLGYINSFFIFEDDKKAKK